MRQVADVVVVGAGMAGLEAAVEVASRSAARVLVVDGAGPVGAPRWRSATPPHYPDRRSHLGAGGRSLAWHGVVLPLEPWALADWPAAVAGPLQDELYPELMGDLAAWAGRPVDRPDGPDARLADRLRELTGTGWQAVPQAVRDVDGARRAYTPVDRWRSAGARQRVAVTAGAVAGLVLSGGRVTGVRLAGGQVLSAAAVLVAAGTVESTRLVARARGLPAQRFPIADHLVEGFVVRLPAGALPAGGLARWPADADGRCAVFARTRPTEGNADVVLLDVWTMGEQLPSSAGGVQVTGTGPAPWEPEVTAGLSDDDRAVVAAGRDRLDRVRAAVGAQPQPPWPSFLQAPRPFERAAAAAAAAPAGRPVSYAWPLGTVDHEGSTLPYGTALDDAGRVQDLPGAWVAGPATFPRPGAANPSLTTLALARRTARLLAGT